MFYLWPIYLKDYIPCSLQKWMGWLEMRVNICRWFGIYLLDDAIIFPVLYAWSKRISQLIHVVVVLKVWFLKAWYRLTLITRFMGPTWGPSRANRTQVGPMLAPWILLSGKFTTTSCEIFCKWMPQNTYDNKSTLVQVMAWCQLATSHYLSQC